MGSQVRFTAEVSRVGFTRDAFSNGLPAIQAAGQGANPGFYRWPIQRKSVAASQFDQQFLQSFNLRIQFSQTQIDAIDGCRDFFDVTDQLLNAVRQIRRRSTQATKLVLQRALPPSQVGDSLQYPWLNRMAIAFSQRLLQSHFGGPNFAFQRHGAQPGLQTQPRQQIKTVGFFVPHAEDFAKYVRCHPARKMIVLLRRMLVIGCVSHA